MIIWKNQFANAHKKYDEGEIIRKKAWYELDGMVIFRAIIGLACAIAAPFTSGGTLVAYIAMETAMAMHKGYKEGGLAGMFMGLVSGAVTGVVQGYTVGAIQLDVGYSYEDGWGGSLSGGYKGARASIGYSEKKGFSAGVELGYKGLGAGVSWNEKEGFSASLGITSSNVDLGGTWSEKSGFGVSARAGYGGYGGATFGWSEKGGVTLGAYMGTGNAYKNKMGSTWTGSSSTLGLDYSFKRRGFDVSISQSARTSFGSSKDWGSFGTSSRSAFSFSEKGDYLGSSTTSSYSLEMNTEERQEQDPLDGQEKNPLHAVLPGLKGRRRRGSGNLLDDFFENLGNAFRGDGFMSDEDVAINKMTDHLRNKVKDFKAGKLKNLENEDKEVLIRFAAADGQRLMTKNEASRYKYADAYEEAISSGKYTMKQAEKVAQKAQKEYLNNTDGKASDIVDVNEFGYGEYLIAEGDKINEFHSKKNGNAGLYEHTADYLDKYGAFSDVNVGEVNVSIGIDKVEKINLGLNNNGENEVATLANGSRLPISQTDYESDNINLGSQYGMRPNPFGPGEQMHDGIDIRCPEGTDVLAVEGGTVLNAYESESYGNTVVIQHDNDTISLYAHNSELLVNTGEEVDAGQKIAESGNTGHSTGPHIHYEVTSVIDYENFWSRPRVGRVNPTNFDWDNREN